MAALDAVKNFGKVTVSTGYDDAATSIVLSSGHGANLPEPSTDGNFNLVWWNFTDYSDPTDDPNKEIVRCTARSTDTLTVTRAQEGTSGSTKNTANKTYKMILTPTAKTITDIQTAIQTGSMVYAADAGSSDTYAITLSPAPTAYTTGMIVNFKANTANTGAATLNVNSLGEITIKKLHDQDLATGDIEADQFVTVIYDGTNFQMQSQIAQTSTLTFNNGADATRSFSAASGTQNIAHGLGKVPTMVRINATLGNNVTIVIAQCFGSYNGTNTSSSMFAYNSGSAQAIAESSSTYIVNLYGQTTGTITSSSQQATITVDATNIALAWTKTGTSHASDNIHLAWEAEG